LQGLAAQGLFSITGEEEVGRPLNCWEYMLCGREPGGRHVNALGVCRAAVEERLNGTHGGINAGRSCWAVAGTVGEGSPSCTYANDGKNCRTCDFYAMVRREEEGYVCPTIFLLWILEHRKP
jgi:hypothetical protein